MNIPSGNYTGGWTEEKALLAISERRGVDSCEQSFSCVLVHASPEYVLAALGREFCVAEYGENVYGSVIEVPDASLFVVLQLQGHSWTVLSRVDAQLPEVLNTEESIASLSMFVQTKVIFFREFDSEYGITLFFYDSGFLKRKIEYSHEFVRGREGEVITSELMNSLLELEPDFEMDYYFREVVPELDVDRVEIFDDYNLITDSVLKANGAYAPCITWPILREKCMFEVSICGLNKGDFSEFKLIRISA
ncbi:hypothetical protein SPB21_20000 [Leptothoe sp. ISB3NOV94-8A]